MPRNFTPEWKEKLSAAAKLRYAEGRNQHLRIGGAHLSAERHPRWKDSDATRAPIHQWLSRQRIKSGMCQKCGAEPRPITYTMRGKVVTRAATDWANVSGRYDRLDLSDWIELCRSCHAKMDRFERNLPPTPRPTHCIHGHPLEQANTYVRSNGTRQCRTCARAYQRKRRRDLGH